MKHSVMSIRTEAIFSTAHYHIMEILVTVIVIESMAMVRQSLMSLFVTIQIHIGHRSIRHHLGTTFTHPHRHRSDIHQVLNQHKAIISGAHAVKKFLRQNIYTFWEFASVDAKSFCFYSSFVYLYLSMYLNVSLSLSQTHSLSIYLSHRDHGRLDETLSHYQDLARQQEDMLRRQKFIKKKEIERRVKMEAERRHSVEQQRLNESVR